MRIIAGTHRGRVLLSPEHASIRPTSDKLRGAIFNILEHAAFVPPLFRENQAVLDLCCGTGALGLEALSRGIGHALFLDQSLAALSLAKKNAALLKTGDTCRFLSANAADLPEAPRRFDLVFLDPPYNKQLIDAALPQLLEKNWLSAEAVIIAETQKHETFVLPPGLTAKDHRTYGDSAVTFLMKG